MERALRVLFVAAECAPFAREGGLGDVVAALPRALRAAGVDARVVIPRYGWISPVSTDGMSKHLSPLGVPLGDAEAWCAVYEASQPGCDVPVYMLDHEVLFDRPYLYDPPGGTARDNLARFACLSRGAFQLAKHLGWVPDVVHAHDWPSALAAVYLATLERRAMFRRAVSVLTLHDVSQQGRFSLDEAAVAQLGADPSAVAGLEDHGGINLLRAAVHHADAVTVISAQQAADFVNPERSAGLDAALRARADGLTALCDATPSDDWGPAALRCLDVYRRALAARRNP